MPSRRPAAPNPRPSRPSSRASEQRPGARAGGRTRATGASKSGAGAGPAKASSAQGKAGRAKPSRTTPRSTRRPAGPSREDRRRSRLGLVLPEVLTVRLLVLGVIVLLAFVLVLPTVRGAVQQQAQIDRLQSELDTNEAQRAELQDELDRWDDRSYVIQQARSRLNYVVPGDTVWRVIDADEIEGDAAAEAAQDAGPAVAAAPTGAPWYEGLWESVQVTDRAVLPAATPGPSGTPAPSGSPAPSDATPSPDGDERDGADDASPAPDGGE